MKRNVIIVGLLIISLNIFSQIDSRRGYEYLAEFSDTNMLYTDIICKNYDDDPWCAVGVYRCEKAFHYSYSHRFEESLSMISVHWNISAIEYTEFFIYDVFQNLEYYIYKAGKSELIYKFVNNDASLIRSSGEGELTNNYFINDDGNYFKTTDILARSSTQLDVCSNLIGIPNYNKELQIVREKYKLTNENKSLIMLVKENAIGYYNGKDLVKIVVKNDITKEYYLDNRKLYFAYYTANNETPELRLYCVRNYPFRVIYGKDNLPKTEEEFWSNADMIREDFNEILSQFE
ncbi:MAG TPA: hypothetical protein PKN32_03410 [Bacteroidales bacterium]|nr:hypothetical protein [Bacteroidales bacterium]